MGINRSDGRPSIPPHGRLLCRRYFSDVLTETNLLLTAVPRPLTTVTIMMLIPAAMMQYSMAVAPDRSLRNFENSCRIQKLLSRFPRVSAALIAGPNLGRIGCQHIDEHAERSVKTELDLSRIADDICGRPGRGRTGIDTGPKIYFRVYRGHRWSVADRRPVE